MQDGSAPRRHGVNRHHRHPQPHARDFGFIHALVYAVEARHVRGRAAHIETDDAIESGFVRRLCHADDAAGGP